MNHKKLCSAMLDKIHLHKGVLCKPQQQSSEQLEVLQTLYFHLQFDVVTLHGSHFHMKVPPPWTLLASGPSSLTRAPDIVLLYSFDHYSMSRTT